MENFNIYIWLPYIGLGILSIFGHFITMKEKNVNLGQHFREYAKDLILSFIAFFTLLFFWIDGSIESLGIGIFKKGEPNGVLVFIVAWFGQSLLGHIVHLYDNYVKSKLDKNVKDVEK